MQIGVQETFLIINDGNKAVVLLNIFVKTLMQFF